MDADWTFGDVAVDLGLVSRADVDAALTRQATEPTEERRPIGLILLDHGVITPADLNHVLRSLRRRMRRVRAGGTEIAGGDLDAIDRRWRDLVDTVRRQAERIEALEASLARRGGWAL